ncbi:terminase small subunit, partial [Klebsiella pneumoniae]|uniref:terminase small subunit n=1 Tax=Klebsiella pneumoniae TaxID=573 RepID=UPI001F51D199
MNGNVTIAKSSVTNVKNPKTKEKLKEILEDEELTEKERLFCLYYVKYFNGTQAALKSGYSKDSAHVQASRLLRRERVSSYIKELKGELVENVFVEAMDVLKEYIKIAFADITNYLNFGQREITIQDDDGNEVTRLVNFVDLYEADMVDGSIITEVKQGRDGISVKLADKMKALDKLAQYFDLVPDTFKEQIEAERHRMNQEMQKVQIEKVKADTEFAKIRAAKLKGQQKDTSLLDALIEGRKQYEQN